jgi:hypothetical protein
LFAIFDYAGCMERCISTGMRRSYLKLDLSGCRRLGAGEVGRRRREGGTNLAAAGTSSVAGYGGENSGEMTVVVNEVTNPLLCRSGSSLEVLVRCTDIRTRKNLVLFCRSEWVAASRQEEERRLDDL